MKLTRWKPLRELEGLSDRLNRLFSHPDRPHTTDEELMTVADWYPPVDIFETPEEFYLKVELPEVKRHDVRVSIDNGVLYVQGQRKEEPEIHGRKVHRVERSYGRFIRSFTLPDSTEAPKISAEFRDGMLYLHLPKSAHSKARAVEVRAV